MCSSASSRWLTASGLTLDEEEKIRAFTDAELAEWNAANDVIHFLLFPEERPQKQLTLVPHHEAQP